MNAFKKLIFHYLSKNYLNVGRKRNSIFIRLTQDKVCNGINVVINIMQFRLWIFWFLDFWPSLGKKRSNLEFLNFLDFCNFWISGNIPGKELPKICLCQNNRFLGFFRLDFLFLSVGAQKHWNKWNLNRWPHTSCSALFAGVLCDYLSHNTSWTRHMLCILPHLYAILWAIIMK